MTERAGHVRPAACTSHSRSRQPPKRVAAVCRWALIFAFVILEWDGRARTVVDVSAKVAVTLWPELIVTLHVPRPEHAPDQPVNVEPPAGAAARVTLDKELEIQTDPAVMEAYLGGVV